MSFQMDDGQAPTANFRLQNNLMTNFTKNNSVTTQDGAKALNYGNDNKVLLEAMGEYLQNQVINNNELRNEDGQKTPTEDAENGHSENTNSSTSYGDAVQQNGKEIEASEGSDVFGGSDSSDILSNSSNLRSEAGFGEAQGIEKTAGSLFGRFGSASSSTMMGGALIGSLNSGLMNSLGSSLSERNQVGEGPSGHNFMQSETNALQQRDVNFGKDIANSAITIGSFFGPEGLAAGAAVAGIADLATYSFAQNDVAMENSTSGSQIAAYDY